MIVKSVHHLLEQFKRPRKEFEKEADGFSLVLGTSFRSGGGRGRGGGGGGSEEKGEREPIAVVFLQDVESVKKADFSESQGDWYLGIDRGLKRGKEKPVEGVNSAVIGR